MTYLAGAVAGLERGAFPFEFSLLVVLSGSFGLSFRFFFEWFGIVIFGTRDSYASPVALNGELCFFLDRFRW